MRTPHEAIGTARCETCIFARAVTIEDKNRKGEVTATREACECHIARPIRFGFPTVRLDDFCANHIDRATLEKTFAGLAPSTFGVS